MPASYNPAAKYDVKIWDEEFRKTPTRTLMARIYQPQGPGPFPTLLDLHGGAWNEKQSELPVPHFGVPRSVSVPSRLPRTTSPASSLRTERR